MNSFTATRETACSCSRHGFSCLRAYRLREHPGAASFAAAWDKAQGWGRGRAVDLGMDRAILGEKRGVYYRGRKIGEYVRHDNRLLMAALNRLPTAAADPDPGETLRRLLGEIDPGGGEPSPYSNAFSPRFA